MEYRIVERAGKKYVVTSGKDRLESEQDALELLGACGESEAVGLVMLAENLSEDFCRLRTGLAGAVLQKFVNYYVPLAAVIPPEVSGRGKFGELVNETNRGNQFRVFATEEDAVKWLLSGDVIHMPTV